MPVTNIITENTINC